MEFNSTSAIIREMANGAMSLSSLLLIIIFWRYCVKNRKSFWHNRTVQVAGAILVLMTGHFLRATGAWIEFFLLRKDIDLVAWLTHSFTWFVTAVMLILFGKALMLYSFTPLKWRWGIIVPGLLMCLIIPVLMVVFT